MSEHITQATYRRENQHRYDHALTGAEANAFWTLIAEAGARDIFRADFIAYMMAKSQHPKEFRFQGKLGWGGKAHFDGERAYVSCYIEDDTPERDEIKSVINDKLKGLLQ